MCGFIRSHDTSYKYTQRGPENLQVCWANNIFNLFKYEYN